MPLTQREHGVRQVLDHGRTESTPEIANELDAASLQWEWLTAAIVLQGAESCALVVAAASESILGSMERITGLYAALTPR